MYDFKGAAQHCLVGRMWPLGRRLESPEAEEWVVPIVTHLRLMESGFGVLCVRMIHFVGYMVYGSKEVDSEVFRMAIQLKYFLWEKGKMADVMLKILDNFSLVWVLMYLYSKSVFLQVTLNFELE